MASAVLRIGGKMLPSLLPIIGETAVGAASGAVGLSVLSDTVDVMTSNPLIPLAIMSILLIVVLKKK